MNDIRFGFIGAGHIAKSSVEAIQKHAHGKVSAVQDLSAERAGELCATYGIPKSYQTVDELLADDEVDAVYIAVPNKFHLPLTLASLQAGKHVLLEKPFAMNYEEALVAAEMASKTGKVLMLGMNQRYLPNPQKARSLVADGTLGEIYHAKAFWYRRTGIPKLGTWFGNRDLAGGGCLYDIGVHLLDLCLFVLDRFDPVSVSGITYTKFGNRGLGEGGWGKSDVSEGVFNVEDFATAFLRFEDGLSLSLDVAWACHTDSGSRMDVQLFGTEAGAHAMKAEVFRRDAASGDYLPVDNEAVPIRFEHCNRFHNFINHLLGTEELGVTLEQALAVQRILDAIATSSKTGREVLLK